MVTRRNFTLAASAAAITAILPGGPGQAAQASAPVSTDMSGPVSIIVPFAKNGTTDQVARLIAPALSEALGCPVQVDNITGDWGTTGAVIAAHRPADGYSLIMGQAATHVVIGRNGMAKRYDPVADFSPVGLVGISPITFVVRVGLSPSNLAELAALARTSATPLSIAHGGFGTPSHIGARKLKAAIDAPQLVEKTYASTMAAMEDVADGRADIMATSLPQALPFIKSGKVKALGLAATSRNFALPEVYTGTQQGYADLRASHWNALFAPKGLALDVQEKLATALARALANPMTQRKMRELGIHVPFVEQQGPEALAALQAREIAEISAVA